VQKAEKVGFSRFPSGDRTLSDRQDLRMQYLCIRIKSEVRNIEVIVCQKRNHAARLKFLESRALILCWQFFNNDLE